MLGRFSRKSADRTSLHGDVPAESDIKIRRPPKKKDNLAKTLVWTLYFFLVAMLAIILGAFAFSLGAQWGQKDADRQFFGLDARHTRLLPPTAISTTEGVFDAWGYEVKRRHVIERKIDSVSLADSLIGDPSDHIFLGVYERDKLNRKSEAALHFYLALSNGHPDAYRLYNELNVPTADYESLYQQFIALHQLNGDLGLERLGQYYLGRDVFRIAARMRTKLRFGRPNDYVWPRQEEAETLAYIHFQMAAICGLTSAYEWRAETARFYKFTEQRENALKQRANNELKELSRRYRTGRFANQDEYCKRAHLIDQFDRLKSYYTSFSAVRNEEVLEDWAGGHPCDEPGHGYADNECDEFDSYIGADGAFSYFAEVPTFRGLLEQLGGNQRRGGGRSGIVVGPGRGGALVRPPGGVRTPFGGGNDSASPAYRNNPGGSVEEGTFAEDGQFEHDCGAPGDENYGECIEAWNRSADLRRLDYAQCNDAAKRQFNLGEADMAVGRTLNARNRLERAIEIGRECQSEYAILAGKRLSALNLTCEYTPRSLARISRGYYDNPEGGAIIDLPSRQRALRAKGHYTDNIDGRYGPATRAAVRRFQRELGFEETGDLTPIETVYLICSAAETHSDLKSINTLGIMYLAGLGVVQNTDRGINWLLKAADRSNEDAMYNLALVYGTGTIVQSYRLCGNVENIDRADSWLLEAANGGHPPARRLVQMFGTLRPSERWVRIRDELELNEFFVERLEPVGEACTPNP
ncbi:MAG: peptidoglycan-binding protein [Pseudomonadota bacterium]